MSQTYTEDPYDEEEAYFDDGYEEDDFDEEEYFSNYFADLALSWDFDDDTKAKMRHAIVELNYNTNMVFKFAQKGQYGAFKKRKIKKINKVVETPVVEGPEQLPAFPVLTQMQQEPELTQKQEPNSSAIPSAEKSLTQEIDANDHIDPAVQPASTDSIVIEEQQTPAIKPLDSIEPEQVPIPTPEVIVIPSPKPRPVIYTQNRGEIRAQKQYIKYSVLLQHAHCGHSAYSLPHDEKERVTIVAEFEPTQNSITTKSGIALTILESDHKVITFVHKQLFVADGTAKEPSFEFSTKRKYRLDDPFKIAMIAPNLGIILSGFVCKNDVLENAEVDKILLAGKEIDFAYPGSVVEIFFKPDTHSFGVYWDIEHPVRVTAHFRAKVPDVPFTSIRFQWQQLPMQCECSEFARIGTTRIVDIHTEREIPVDFNPTLCELNQFMVGDDQQSQIGTVIDYL